MSTSSAQAIIQQRHPIKDALSAAVPLWAAQCLQEPPLQAVLDRVKRHRLEERFWEAGEAILFRVPGKTADGFNCLAETIAILAFSPGGVRCFGMHFEYVHGRPWLHPDNKHGVPDKDSDGTTLESLADTLAKRGLFTRNP